MSFDGRPGVSPALATLISMKKVERTHKILDVGCGDGVELLLLAGWGFEKLIGIEQRADLVESARSRAARRGVSERVNFLPLRAQQLMNHFTPNTFDLVLHTLVGNNPGGATDLHVRNVHGVMKPRGNLLLQCRIDGKCENAAPDALAPPGKFGRYFALGPGIATHLPEYRQRKNGRDFAKVISWIGRPRP